MVAVFLFWRDVVIFVGKKEEDGKDERYILEDDGIYPTICGAYMLGIILCDDYAAMYDIVVKE